MGSSRERRKSESGQSLVEFALVLPLLLLVIMGIFEFGKTINYWIDQNQIASEGARWVVVNKVPSGVVTTPALYKAYITSQAETQELQNLAAVKVCFPNGTTGGNPATVSITSNYNPIPLLKVATIKITSKATLRTEQAQSTLSGWDTGC